MSGELATVGVSALAQRIYEALLDRPGSSLVDLAAATDTSERALARVLAGLERDGLVSRSATRPPRFLPAAPDVALEVLVLRRQEELEQVRVLGRRLLGRAKAAQLPNTGDLVEVISGREAIVQRFHQLQVLARDEILAFDKPPYVVGRADNEQAQMEALQHHVVLRTIYESAALEQAGALDLIAQVTAAGERARVAVSVPLKLIIVDRRYGLIPLRLGGADEYAIVVHVSPLLDALIDLFERVWTASSELRLDSDAGDQGEAGEVPSADYQRVLMAMLAGLTEQSMARQLGLNERTVSRRVERMMKILGAQTRFQLAIRAVERGWIALPESGKTRLDPPSQG